MCDLKNYQCPDCEEDLREVGIYQLTKVSYDFDESSKPFKEVDSQPFDNYGRTFCEACDYCLDDEDEVLEFIGL